MILSSIKLGPDHNKGKDLTGVSLTGSLCEFKFGLKQTLILLDVYGGSPISINKTQSKLSQLAFMLALDSIIALI